MKKKLVSAIVCTGFCVSFITGCSSGGSTSNTVGNTQKSENAESSAPSVSNDKNVTLTFGGIQSAEDTVSLAMEKMAELANEKSGGTIQINVSPAAQLGDATSQLEAVSLGTQELFVDGGAWLSTFVSDASVVNMFFNFKDEEHYLKYLDSDIEKSFEDKLLEKEGIRVIANNWLRSPRSICCQNDISGTSDIKGLKMRVPDIKAYLESTAAMGFGTTQIAWGETYLALQQGVVEACESPMDSIYTMKFYEAAPKILLTEHVRENMAVYMNDDIFDSLSENQQTALLEAAKEAGDWYTEQVKIAADEYKKIMESEGAEFNEMNDDFRSELQSMVAERAYKLENDGLWEKGLYDKIQELAD